MHECACTNAHTHHNTQGKDEPNLMIISSPTPALSYLSSLSFSGCSPVCMYIHAGQLYRHFIIGTGGYVLNKAALRTFVHGMHSSSCRPDKRTSSEDVQISACMRSLGARTVPILQRFGRFSPTLYYTAKISGRRGTSCCVRDLVSLHYMRAWEIRWFHRSLYCNMTTDHDAIALP